MSKVRFQLMACAPLLLLCLSGCGGGGDSSSSSGPTGQYGPILVTEQTDKTSYSLGESVNVNFAWKNTGGMVQPYIASAPSFDVTIYHGGKKVWDSFSSLTAVPASALRGELQPAGVYSNNIAWDQKDQSGHALPPGTYLVTTTSSIFFTSLPNNNAYNHMVAKTTTIEIY